MPSQKKDDNVCIIYNQKNDSPKFFEISKSEILGLVIGLPTLSLFALVLGIIGIIHTSPFHLIESYKQNLKARAVLSQGQDLDQRIQNLEEQNIDLKSKLKSAEDQILITKNSTAPNQGASTEIKNSPTIASNVALSIFRPVTGFKDRSKPAILNLTGFTTKIGKDTVELTFNIIPAGNGDEKLAGFILVMMKNELGIQFYPGNALASNDNLINYTTGEPFATQRFRPVVASFLKPRRSGNYFFTVYIFAKNGDLIHLQSTSLPLKI